ncbi:MAG: Coenzyme F420 hydrogenase/dehydrogenase, beta subunit C-terminal domain [Bacteroidaceae bacterium]
MIDICPKEKCTACYACVNTCKHDAIKMVEDECGYLYPYIEAAKCVDCGACQKTCPAINETKLNYPNKCYAASIASDDVMNSSSGGAAYIISKYLIEQEGVVYGCSGADILNVKHVRVDTIDQLEQLRGSKYVQSQIGNSYEQCKTDLKAGRLTLFIGTPCQIAGLKSYLKVDYDNLYTCDLVCHGVPSQKMLNSEINYYIKGDQISSNSQLLFRQKIIGPKFNSFRIEYGLFLQNNPYSSFSIAYPKESYLFAFINCLIFRESCYQCKYATAARVADITLSDFWCLGADANLPEGRGVSCCLVNTSKGAKLFSEVKYDMRVVERKPIEAIRGNGQLQRPSVKSTNYYKFLKMFSETGDMKKSIDTCYKKEYINIVYVEKIKALLRKIL